MSAINTNIQDEKKQTDDEEQEDGDVAILDAGAQYGKLIDRRVRELNIKSVLIPFNTSSNKLKKYKAIIISGGPSSVYANDAPKYDKNLFKLNIPIFAICYGFQLMIHVFNGEIERGHQREDGQFDINIIKQIPSKLFANINKDKINVLLTHGDIVKSMPTVPAGFNITAVSTNGIISAGENASMNIYGVQFHPEVDLTPDGKQIFKNFLYDICGLHATYTLDNRMNIAIDYIRNKVGDKKKVLCLVSGGVDSSVCCALLHKALNDIDDDSDNDDDKYQDILDIALDCKHLLQHKKPMVAVKKKKEPRIYPVHVDHGLMRYNESVEVVAALTAFGIDNIHVSNAQDYFLNGKTVINGIETLMLSETINPEHKRKIIGDLFMRLCDKVVKEDIFKDNINKITFDDMLLCQGTLRPDLIESASKIANRGGNADIIKTHHNDTELVRKLRAKGQVIEPLTDYHKDEVRLIGKSLGLPPALIWRQPFPGPGLGIRILCSDGVPYTTNNDDTILDMLNNKYNNNNISCCLLGIRTVGVQGDGRSYAHCVGLTLNNNCNDRDNINWNELYQLAKDIPRTCLNVNRCVFIYGNQLLGKQSSVTATYLKPDIIEQLRKCDKIVNDILYKYNLTKTISQVPVVLFPSNFGNNDPNARSICIRTFITNDFMTGVPAKINKDIKQDIVFEMFDNILKIDGIQRVAFDLTPKPPGTTEWE